jgi:NAD(P)H-dependent FMN reductase
MICQEGNQDRILFLLGSARNGGNSETLARRAATTIPDAVCQVWIRLADYQLPLFEDIRHEGQGVYPEPIGTACRLLTETLEANHIVVVAPLYWYALPASVKLYFDHWSGWMRVPGVEFRARMRDKTLYGISSYSDQRPEVARPFFDSLRLTAAYMDMHYGGEILSEGNRPGDVLNDTSALEQADRLFRFVFPGHCTADLNRCQHP